MNLKEGVFYISTERYRVGRVSSKDIEQTILQRGGRGGGKDLNNNSKRDIEAWPLTQ